jgi:hypothetical protein
MLNGFIFAYCLTFGLSFLVSTFVIFPTRERSNGSKHSQFISGVTASSYWLTSFVWDLVKYTIPALCILAIIEAFQVDAYVYDIHIWYVAGIFISVVNHLLDLNCNFDAVNDLVCSILLCASCQDENFEVLGVSVTCLSDKIRGKSFKLEIPIEWS